MPFQHVFCRRHHHVHFVLFGKRKRNNLSVCVLQAKLNICVCKQTQCPFCLCSAIRNVIYVCVPQATQHGHYFCFAGQTKFPLQMCSAGESPFNMCSAGSTPCALCIIRQAQTQWPFCSCSAQTSFWYLFCRQTQCPSNMCFAGNVTMCTSVSFGRRKHNVHFVCVLQATCHVRFYLFCRQC